jgi:hypothetical protein
MKTAEDFVKEIYRYEVGKQATDTFTFDEWETMKVYQPITQIINAMKEYAKAAIEEQLKLTGINWIALSDDYPEDNQECLWCTMPICEPPIVDSICGCDFPGVEYFTHWAPLKNEHFPIDNQVRIDLQ